MNRPVALEKKILLVLTLIAGVSLLWVFEFLGRERAQNDFTHESGLQDEEAMGFEQNSAYVPAVDYLKPGHAVHRQERTNFVLREGVGAAEGVDKLTLTIEKPVKPLPAVTSCEQKRIDNLHRSETPQFCIQSLQVQPSKEWPNEYEIIFQRLRGDWSDLEAATYRNGSSNSLLEVYSTQQNSAPKI